MTRARLVGIFFFFKESVTLLSWKVNMNLLDHCGRHELSHISSPGNLQKSLEGRKGEILIQAWQGTKMRYTNSPIHSFIQAFI